MKTWKIILLIIVGLIILFIGFVFYNSYQYSKFYDEAESMGSVRFGSELFNEKLENCQLTYADTWEVRGLENNKCVVSFIWDNDVNYKEGIIIHNWVVCGLSYELYSQAEKIEWGKLVNSEYCERR